MSVMLQILIPIITNIHETFSVLVTSRLPIVIYISWVFLPSNKKWNRNSWQKTCLYSCCFVCSYMSPSWEQVKWLPTLKTLHFKQLCVRVVAAKVSVCSNSSCSDRNSKTLFSLNWHTTQNNFTNLLVALLEWVRVQS